MKYHGWFKLELSINCWVVESQWKWKPKRKMEEFGFVLLLTYWLRIRSQYCICVVGERKCIQNTWRKKSNFVSVFWLFFFLLIKIVFLCHWLLYTNLSFSVLNILVIRLNYFDEILPHYHILFLIFSCFSLMELLLYCYHIYYQHLYIVFFNIFLS